MSAKMPMSSNVIPSKNARADNSRVKELNSMLINGTLSQSTYQRLTSLAPPRDLTLGGKAVPAKKAFKPNLNVVRNKNVNVKTSKDMTAPRVNKRATHTKQERVSTLIQTKGVFSEGAGDMSKPKAYGSRSSTHAAWSEESSLLQKPVINRGGQKVQKQENDKDLAAKLRDILGEGEENTLDDDKTDLDFKPIKLLENNFLKKSHKKFSAIKKERHRLDSEVDEIVENGVTKIELEPIEKTNSAPLNMLEFFAAKSPQLFVIQFPDELPCETDEGADRTVNKSAADKDSEKAQGSETKRQSLVKYLSKESVEGCVGKLQRFKSGKVKLLLGKTIFDLEMGYNSNIPQDLVSIEASKESGKNAKIVNLGSVNAKFTATPDWDFLIQQQHMTSGKESL